MAVYSPREDSYFLSEVLGDYLKGFDKGIRVLDMGSGSGIQADTCRRLGFENVVVDIDEEAVLFLKKKKFNVIKSDLFSNVEGRFDLIIFNPPYLPNHKYDMGRDTAGGKEGYETILEFLKQAKFHLRKGGRVLLLYSSLSKPRVIKGEAKKLGYKIDVLSERSFFGEELFIVELSL